MKRNNGVWAIAVAGAALLWACTPQTECDYIDREVADPLHPVDDDVAYCWQGYDAYGLYAMRFEVGTAGGSNIVFVEDSPNSLEPAGQEYVSRWSLDNNVSTPDGPVALLSLPDLPIPEQVIVQVNRTSMLFGSDTGTSALRRAVCRGFGFETAEKQCRGSESRP